MFNFSAPDSDPETEETSKNSQDSKKQEHFEVSQIPPKDLSPFLEDKSLEYDGESQSLLRKEKNIEIFSFISCLKFFFFHHK
jgi:hypothetical protein